MTSFAGPAPPELPPAPPGVDDVLEAQSRKRSLADQDANRMVHLKRTVPETQSSSVLLTMAVGLLWRIEALRIDKPDLFVDLRNLRVPFAFARRNPLAKTTFDKAAGGGDWSDTATVSLSFSDRADDLSDAHLDRSSVPAIVKPNIATDYATPDILASSFEVRYLDLLEIINLAVASVSRFAISPDDCHYGQDVLPTAAAFDSAADRGGNDADAWRKRAAKICESEAFRQLDFRVCESLDSVLRLYVQNITDRSATRIDEDGERVRMAGKRSPDHNMYADQRVRVYATTVDPSAFENSSHHIDGGIQDVLARRNRAFVGEQVVDDDHDDNDDDDDEQQQLLDPRVRFKMTYLQMNTIDQCMWTPANESVVSIGSIFKREYDEQVQTDLRARSLAATTAAHAAKKKVEKAAAAATTVVDSGPQEKKIAKNAASSARHPLSSAASSLTSTKNSTEWRDLWSEYIADIVAARGTALETKEDVLDLFASEAGLARFRALMQRRRAALGSVPNYRAVAFHMLDAVDSLLVELIGAEPSERTSVVDDAHERAEHVPKLNRFFRKWGEDEYTNYRLLAYPLDRTACDHDEYEYDFERRDIYSGSAERKAVDNAAIAIEKEYYDDDNVRDNALRAHHAQKYYSTSMFEPHYAARRFYRHFLSTLAHNGGKRNAFAPLVPTKWCGGNEKKPAAAAAAPQGAKKEKPSAPTSAQFSRLFAEHFVSANLRDTAHVADVLDDVAIERALDNGFLLTFLSDPIGGIDPSEDNRYRTLYSVAVRPNKNPFRRFAEQVDFYLFGSADDRAAVVARYPDIVAYVDQYVMPRIREDLLFRKQPGGYVSGGDRGERCGRDFGRNAGIVPLVGLIEQRLCAQVEAAKRDIDSTPYKPELTIAAFSALRYGVTWAEFEPALQFITHEDHVMRFNGTLQQFHTGSVTFGTAHQFVMHCPRSDWQSAQGFVQTVLACPAPFNRNDESKSLPFSLLYDYGLYCIDRKLQNRVALSVATMRAPMKYSTTADDVSDAVASTVVIKPRHSINRAKKRRLYYSYGASHAATTAATLDSISVATNASSSAARQVVFHSSKPGNAGKRLPTTAATTTTTTPHPRNTPATPPSNQVLPRKRVAAAVRSQNRYNDS